MIFIKILQADKFYGLTEEIEIAKGKYELPTTLKDITNQAKRRLKWLLRKQ